VRILFIGGTGIISTACSSAALAAGHELWLLNRGLSRLPTAVPPERILRGDATDEQQVRSAVGNSEWDVVVQWVGYVPRQVRQDLEVFAGAVGQYIFISSASVYEKPPSHWKITESTPTVNPFWRYSRDKIACEAVLHDAWQRRGFPVTIVRPSHTYGPSQIPVAVGSWRQPFTIVDRMRRGKWVVVPGDGTSIWTVTHASDFAKGFTGLFGQRAALGEDFHITSDEALTWNQIYSLVAAAAGVEPRLLHVPTDAIVASDPGDGSMWGDKSNCAVFDNSKLRGLVPGYQATVPFSEGIKQTVAWFDEDRTRQGVDEDANQRWDRLTRVYEEALLRAAS
jgi:nucleoside-diphosphate-sugar epimerase